MTASKSRSIRTLKRSDAYGAGQAAGTWNAVERDDAALLRLDPIERRVVGALRHREDAAGVGLEQDFRRDVDGALISRLAMAVV